MSQKEFEAKINNVRTILQWVCTEIESALNKKSLRKVELAAEEAIVNIIKHSHSNKLDIELKVFPKSRIEIVVKDKGVSFNPLEYKKLNNFAPLEQRAEGGLGIHFMKECMDQVLYNRIDDTNILTMVKKIEPSEDGSLN